MSASLSPVIAAATFDPRSPQQRQQLTDLYAAYLLEELARTGQAAPGAAIAHYLHTLLIWRDDDVIGFCSVDPARHAVELVYVQPDSRRRRIASRLLTDLRDSCPGTLRAKAPLTPLGQALVDSVGIGVTRPSAFEEERARRSLEGLHQTIRANCRHERRRGDPARPCPRCYRRTLRQAAQQIVAVHSVAASVVAA